MIGSIRGKVLVGVLAGTLVILATCAVMVRQVSLASLLRSFDEDLAARARSLAALVEFEDGRYEFENVDRVLPEYQRADQPEYFEIWGADGRTIARSLSLGESQLDAVVLTAASGAKAIRLIDGRPGRLAWVTAAARSEDRQADPPDVPGVRVAIAKSTEELQRQQDRLTRLLGLIGMVTLGLIGAVLAGVVWLGLQPVAGLAGQIDRLDPEHLTTRLTLPNAPTELQPMVQVCNQLLDRLHQAMERERSFTADVAHELRTPLAGMRSLLEVALQNRRDADAYQATLSQCLSITLQMQVISTQLLQLARLDRGQCAIRPVPVAIEPMLREIWSDYADAVERKQVQVQWVSSDTPVEVLADPALMRQVIINLLDNAARYVDGRGRITLSTGTRGSEGIVQIANTGSRIAPEDAGRVFERFWRGDAARTGDELHAGLGLCLARRIVEAMQGRVSVTSQIDGPFLATFVLPLAGKPALSGEPAPDKMP